MFPVANAGINLTGYQTPPRATNFFRQNPRHGESFSVQNSGPRVEKTKQNPHSRGIICLLKCQDIINEKGT